MELRLVHWIDAAHTADQGWVDPDDEGFGRFGISQCRCVGFVVRESVDEVVLAQSVDDRHGRVDACMAIPKVAITKSTTLRKSA